MRVNAIEVENGEAMPSYELLKTLEKQYPENAFFFIIGVDLLPTLKYWHHAEKLVDEVFFFIYQREGYAVKKEELPEHFILVENRSLVNNVSSSGFRERYRSYLESEDETLKAAIAGEMMRIVPEEAWEYIVRGKLYTDDI